MKVVDKRMVFINSNERDSGSINNFTITLPPHLLKRRKNQKMRIVLNDLVLPYTWFNVQTTNRSFMSVKITLGRLSRFFYNLAPTMLCNYETT